MHVLVVAVKIDLSEKEALHQGVRDQVIPKVAASPGFVSGYWTSGEDETVLTSFVSYDTEENAQKGADLLRNSPRPTSVSVTSVEVRKVIAEA